MTHAPRFGVLTLGLALVLAPMLHNTTAANFNKQGRERLLRKIRERHPVTVMTNPRVKGAPVSFDQKFDADDDWLKGLTVTVTNTSLKPITYVDVTLELFDEKDGEADGKLPVVFSLSFGEYTGNLSSRPAAEPPPSETIQPGGLVDISLTDENYASLMGILAQNGYPRTMKYAGLSVTDVIFADDTRWYKGMLLRRDPDDPKEWLRIRGLGKKAQKSRRPPSPAAFNPSGASAAFFLASYGPGGPWTLAFSLLTSPSPPRPAVQAEGCREARPAEDIPCGPEVAYCTAKSDRLHDYAGTEGSARLITVQTGNCTRPASQGGECNKQIPVSKLEWCEVGECDCDWSTAPLCPASKPIIECCQCYSGSPILVDVAGDGLALTGGSGGVSFDLNGDGSLDNISWSAGADDSWLVLDRNGNDYVDSGREMFGNFTEQPEPAPGEAPNGFLALAEFDRPAGGGNSDGRIDARDAVFPSPRLWRDANRNAVSEPAELHTLPALGLASIGLDYKESQRTDEHGNQFRYRAKVDDAKGAKAGRWAWDVFLVSGP